MVAVRLFKNSRGQEAGQGAGGAAFLVLIIAILIIFYLLFLPPDDREALLNDDVVPGTPNTVSGGFDHLLYSSPLDENVGRVDYVKDSAIEHDLSSFTIYTQTDATLIATSSGMIVKNSAFDRETYEMPFTIDRHATEDVYLTFNVYRPDGELMIYLNGIQLFKGELAQGSVTPIPIPASQLKNDNVLFFSVSSPGFAFWRVNQYQLQNVRVSGDVTDASHSFNRQKIYLAQAEYEKLESAKLEFYPDCTYANVGNIIVNINGEQAYYGTPDCGLKNFVTLSSDNLVQGENNIEFISERGSYIIDRVVVKTELEEPEYPIYYFDLHEDLFTTGKETDAYCGKVDGICPEDCDSYEDKDCCFADSRQNYWCDMRTVNARDRCVNMVLASNTERCASGYEDVRGDPPEEGEGNCGDDTDDYCPPNCNTDQDKDCCFQVPGAYWCDDIPFTGYDDTCTTSVTPAECNACPNQYIDEDRKRPNCPDRNYDTGDEELELKAGVNVIVDAYFVNEDYKKVDFIINSDYTVPIDTYSSRIKKKINDYVREGTNSLVISPRKDVDIASLKVTIE